MTRTVGVVLFVTATSLLVGSCGGDGSLPRVGKPIPDNVSLVALAQSPDLYDRALVRVSGWCRIEFEGNALYVDSSAFDGRVGDRGIWLNFGWPVSERVRALDGKYVSIEGRFRAGTAGHEGAFPGRLDEISHFEILPFGAQP